MVSRNRGTRSWSPASISDFSIGGNTVFQIPWWSCCLFPPPEGGSSLPSGHSMTLPFPSGTGGLPTTMQDRRQPLHPVGWPSCPCRCRGTRHISNNQEQWAGLVVAHSSFGSGSWGVPGISELSRAPHLHAAETALLPEPPSTLQPAPPALHQPEGHFMVHLYQEQEGRGQRARWQCQNFPAWRRVVQGLLPGVQEALECCRTLSTSLTHQLYSSTDPAQPCRQPRQIF